MNYDQFLSALALWREARGSSVQALAAIWHVIHNRTEDAHNRWPKTVPGVILQHAQFSSFSAGDPNATKFPTPPAPGAVPNADWKAWLDCMTVAQSPGFDPTGGATNYESCEPDKLPSWADPARLTLTCGPFRFYKL